MTEANQAEAPAQTRDASLWLCIAILVAMASVQFWISHDKYIYAGSGYVYDMTAEVYKRLVFTGGIEEIDSYARQIYGNDPRIREVGWGWATDAEKPLYVYFLAVLKLIQSRPVLPQYILVMGMYFASIWMLADMFLSARRNLLLLAGGLLLSPFFTYHALFYEPNGFSVFPIVLGVYLHHRKHAFWGFFAMALGIFSHPGTLPIVGAFGIYHLLTVQNWRTRGLGVLGGMVGWLACELLLLLLFWNDTQDLFPHEFLLERFVGFKSIRIRGDVAQAASLLSYWKASLVYLPIATLGIFWVRSWRQFALTLAPVLIYLIMFKGTMHGAHRIFLPVYMIGFVCFLAHTFSAKSRLVHIGVGAVMAWALVLSIVFHAVTFCMPARPKHETVRLRIDPDVKGSGYSFRNLHWQLSGTNTIDESGAMLAELTLVPASEAPSLLNPYPNYPYCVHHILSAGLPDAWVNQFGWIEGKRVEFRVVRETPAHE